MISTTRAFAPSSRIYDFPCWPDDPHSSLILVFGHADIDIKTLIAALRFRFPLTPIAGCSGLGSMHREHLTDELVSTMFLHSACGKFQVASSTLPRETSAAAQVAHELTQSKHGELNGAIFFASHSNHWNGSPCARGIALILPHSATITGALAGGETDETTWIVAGGDIIPSGVVGIGIYQSAHLHIERGCGLQRDTAKTGVVTSSDGTMIHSINGRPAAREYCRILGLPWETFENETRDLLHPVVVGDRQDSVDNFRTPIAITKHGGLRFAGEVREGETIQPTRESSSGTVTAAIHHAINGASLTAGDDAAMLILASAGQRSFYEARGDARKTIPHLLQSRHTPRTAGAFVHGELCSRHNRLDFTTQTIVAAAICDCDQR